ncbi:MAG: glycosyltransferase family 2 protein [Flavobacterium sp.]
MKLSTALCTYNGEKFIRQQLDSILRQTLAVNEIIICDDVSTDSTPKILEEYRSRFPDIIKLHVNEHNLRSTKNFQKAVNLCTGDYIFCSDQDDIWLEDKAEKIIAIFNENPKLEGIFSDAALIDDNGEVFTKKSLWDSVNFFEKLYPKPVDLFEIMTSKGNMVTGATFCFKKEVKDFIFPFPSFKYIYHDEWIALLLAARGTLGYTPEKLTHYRIHSAQQVGATAGDMAKSIADDALLTGRCEPKTFDDYKTLSRMHYRNYSKLNDLSTQYKSVAGIDFKAFAAKKLQKFRQAEQKMKQASPLFYFVRKISDILKGKRKL